MLIGLSVPGVTLQPNSTESWEATITPEDMLQVAKKADELGFDFLGVPEHAVMLEKMIPVMGPRWPHPLVTLAVFAGATKHIRLLNTVVVLGYHHPVELAKMIATLDWLSGGRVTVGLGVGYLRREFAIMNSDHANRGPIANEMIESMIEMWSKDEPAFKGEYFQFDRITFEPKPVQQPYPPIWIGGHSVPSMKRAAKYGDGWQPWQITREELPGKLAYIRDQGGATGPRKFDVVMPLFEAKMDMRHTVIEAPKITTEKDQILAEIDALKAAGATGTTFATTPTKSVDEFVYRMEAFASEIFPAVGKK